jgi:carbonic anhydrase
LLRHTPTINVSPPQVIGERMGQGDERNVRTGFLTGGLAAAGGAVAAGTLSTIGAPSLAFAAAPKAPTPKNGDEALARLLAGNKRFAQGKTQSPRRDSVRRTEVAQGQKPFAIIHTCSDSRLAPEVVFDEGLGDLFVVRVAGNTAPDPILIGSMEYSALNFGSVLLMVLGHDRCGAVEAAIDVVTKGYVPPGEIGAATAPIVPAVQAVQGQPAGQLLDAAIRENVKQTVQSLEQVPTLAELVQGGKLKIVGYEYQLHTGKVTAV